MRRCPKVIGMSQSADRTHARVVASCRPLYFLPSKRASEMILTPQTTVETPPVRIGWLGAWRSGDRKQCDLLDRLTHRTTRWTRAVRCLWSPDDGGALSVRSNMR